MTFNRGMFSSMMGSVSSGLPYIDETTYATNTVNTSTTTPWADPFTSTSDPLIIVVSYHNGSGSSTSMSTVKFNSVNMTEIEGRGNSESIYAGIWILMNPTPGTFNFTFTSDLDPNRGYAWAAANFKNVSGYVTGGNSSGIVNGDRTIVIPSGQQGILIGGFTQKSTGTNSPYTDQTLIGTSSLVDRSSLLDKRLLSWTNNSIARRSGFTMAELGSSYEDLDYTLVDSSFSTANILTAAFLY
jgi:hypothetical protein